MLKISYKNITLTLLAISFLMLFVIYNILADKNNLQAAFLSLDDKSGYIVASSAGTNNLENWLVILDVNKKVLCCYAVGNNGKLELRAARDISYDLLVNDENFTGSRGVSVDEVQAIAKRDLEKGESLEVYPDSWQLLVEHTGSSAKGAELGIYIIDPVASKLAYYSIDRDKLSLRAARNFAYDYAAVFTNKQDIKKMSVENLKKLAKNNSRK